MKSTFLVACFGGKAHAQNWTCSFGELNYHVHAVLLRQIRRLNRNLIELSVKESLATFIASGLLRHGAQLFWQWTFARTGRKKIKIKFDTALLLGLSFLVSTYVVCERLSVMHKQVCVHIPQTVKFVFKFSRKPLSGISDWKAPPNGKLQIWDDHSLLPNTPPPPRNGKTSYFRWPKFTLKYPPEMENFRYEMTKVYSEIPPPPMENFRFEMTKVYSKIPPLSPKWKTSDMRWPKFTPKYPPTPKWKTSYFRWPKFTLKKYPPEMENFRYEMTKVYSKIPPQWKTSDLRWPKFTPKYPPSPEMENFRYEMTKVYSEIPPQWKTSYFRWTKFTLKYPPEMENFRYEMTKVYSEIPPLRNGKLQIWDDQSLLRNGKLQIWDDQSLLWNTPPPPNGLESGR